MQVQFKDKKDQLKTTELKREGSRIIEGERTASRNTYGLQHQSCLNGECHQWDKKISGIGLDF